MSNPHLLCVEVEESPAPAQEFLSELGVAQATLDRIRQSKPYLLYISVDRVLRGRIEYLMELLGSTSHVARTINRFPDVLGLCTKTNVIPTIKFLEYCKVQNIDKVIRRHPQILGKA